MPTLTERAFAEQMEAKGWQVYKYGFPDFLCIKDDRFILVEVKANKKDHLKPHQIEVLGLLTNRKFESFVWSPDDPQLLPLEVFETRANEKSTSNKSHPHIYWALNEPVEHIHKIEIDQKRPLDATPERALAMNEAGVKQCELAKLWGISPGRISRLIAKARKKQREKIDVSQ